MNTTTASEPLFIGVDVSSKHLDVACYAAPGVKRLKNSIAPICAWLGKLPSNSCIAMESTGRYHQALAMAAREHGFTVYVLNPRDVRHYAQGMGTRGKTDRLDALILARYIAHEFRELRPWQPQPAGQTALDELLRQRASVGKHQQAMRMSLQGNAPYKDELMKAFSKVKAAIDADILRAAVALSAKTQDFEHITSVPGLGPLSGGALLGVFRRLVSRGSDAVIAFLGMDLRPMDSGQKTGLRRMSKRGPAEWRRLLFNAARSAAQTNTWRPFYERELAKGLSPTAAANILARKLVRVAFSVFKSGSFFDPSIVVMKSTCQQP